MEVDSDQLTVISSNTDNRKPKTDNRSNYLHKDIPHEQKRGGRRK